MILRTLCVVAILAVSSAQAQENPVPENPDVSNTMPMTMQRLGEIILKIDPDARPAGSSIALSILDIPIIVVADARADRMRAMVPIRSAEGLEKDELLRLMQANFDSALDARYAVAQGRLWAVFIHPLSVLEDDEFLLGLAQTINIARTYGQTYSGGANVYGGGDSNEIYEDLLEELRKGQAL